MSHQRERRTLTLQINVNNGRIEMINAEIVLNDQTCGKKNKYLFNRKSEQCSVLEWWELSNYYQLDTILAPFIHQLENKIRAHWTDAMNMNQRKKKKQTNLISIKKVRNSCACMSTLKPKMCASIECTTLSFTKFPNWIIFYRISVIETNNTLNLWLDSENKVL